MALSIADQTRVFLMAAALGLALGHFYDLLYCLLAARPRKSGRLLRAALDFFFCAAAMTSLPVFMLIAGEGELRAYIPVGAALGLTLYFLALSKLTRAWMTPLLRLAYAVAARGKKAILALFSHPRGN